jgi:ketosteroid isomerase-like protein
MNNNTDTVMGIYAAFGRGDVPHILDQLSNDIVWDDGIRTTDVPYLQPGTGKQHVVEFFTALGANLEFTTFEPGRPCAAEDVVMVPVREASRNLRTGRPVEEDLFVHIWTFGGDGKVVAFRHVGDWARHEFAADSAAAVGSTSGVAG